MNEIRKSVLIIVCVITGVLHITAFSNKLEVFEKNGKYGIIDNSTGKIIVKPKYIRIVPSDSYENAFLAQTFIDDSFEGKKLCWGVIDKSGKNITPFNADSIKTVQGGFLAFISEYEEIKGTNKGYKRCRAYKYSLTGERLSSIPFETLYTLPGGYVTENGYVLSLYNRNFEEISNFYAVKKINNDFNYLITQDNPGPKYTIWDSSSLNTIAANISPQIWGNDESLIIFSKGNDYGFIDFKNNKKFEPEYELKKLDNGNLAFYKYGDYETSDDDFLIQDEKNDGVILTPDGKLIPAKAIKFINKFHSPQIEILPISPDGKIILNGMEVSDILAPRALEGDVSVCKDGKWGLYNMDEKEFSLPCLLEGPVYKILDKKFALSKTEEARILYALSGEKIIECPKSEEIGSVDDGYVYTIARNQRYTGVYSLKNKKWLFKPGEYENIYRIGVNYAVEVAPDKYNFVNGEGHVLYVMENVSGFQDYGDLTMIKSTSGKIGFLNTTTGKWILPCKFNKDVAWGSGSGINQKFAVSQSSANGDLVSIYTLGGNKIAERFFPNGTKRSVVVAFGRAYLYR